METRTCVVSSSRRTVSQKVFRAAARQDGRCRQWLSGGAQLAACRQSPKAPAEDRSCGNTQCEPCSMSRLEYRTARSPSSKQEAESHKSREVLPRWRHEQNRDDSHGIGRGDEDKSTSGCVTHAVPSHSSTVKPTTMFSTTTCKRLRSAAKATKRRPPQR